MPTRGESPWRAKARCVPWPVRGTLICSGIGYRKSNAEGGRLEGKIKRISQDAHPRAQASTTRGEGPRL